MSQLRSNFLVDSLALLTVLTKQSAEPSIKLFSVNKVELITLFCFPFVLNPFFFCVGSDVNVVALKRITSPKTMVLKRAGSIQFQEYPRQPPSHENLSTKGFINLIRVLKRYRINIDLTHHLCYFNNKVKFKDLYQV